MTNPARSTPSSTRSSTARSVAIRVPGITAWFWLVKILTTGAGESTSDWLGHHYPHEVVGGIGGALLVVSLVLQFRMRRYLAWAYWFAVSMVAVVGTMFADVVHSVGIPYLGSTVVLALLLAIVFWLWHRSERTLSIHSITISRREAYYWAAVMVTFALGTAAGDLTATTFGWGYLTSGIVFLIAIALVGVAHVVAHRRGGPDSTNAVLAFWIAYILTRPLGASFADLMGEPRDKGGLEWGGGTVSVILWVLIILLVAYLAVTKKDVQDDVAM